MRLLQRPTHARRVAGHVVIAATLVAGCETRNPYEVSRQRQQQPAGAPGAAAPAAAASSPVAAPSRLFPEAPEVQPRTSVPAGAVKIDIARAWKDQTMMILPNDPVYPPHMAAIFDGDTTSLARSEDVNPLVLSLEFAPAIRLAAVRIFPSYSSYDWGIEPVPGKPPVVARNVVADAWSGIGFDTPVETHTVRIHLRRLERDNMVHLNELEVWTTPVVGKRD